MHTLTASSFKPGSCQATVFTAQDELDTGDLIGRLLPKWNRWFDGKPVVLPNIQGLPAQAPRIILTSKSDEWRCEISPSRLNLYRKGSTKSELSLVSFASNAADFLLYYLRQVKTRAGRLAIVVNWYAEHQTPALFLAKHFCREDWLSAPLNRPESFELHAHKRYALTEKFMVNSWVRNRTATMSSGGTAQPVVSVEQDLNTLAEELRSRSFTEDDCLSFLQAATPELPKILGLYFPEGPDGTH